MSRRRTVGIPIKWRIFMAPVVRHAAYADKLLRGARTAELPIEQPTQFELVVNMKTAAALSITLPPATLLFASRRIE